MKVMNPERLETALLLTTLEDWAAESGTTVDEVGEMIVTTVLRWFGRQVEQVWGYPPEGAHLRLLGMTEPDIIPVELLNRKGERINICDVMLTEEGFQVVSWWEVDWGNVDLVAEAFA